MQNTSENIIAELKNRAFVANPIVIIIMATFLGLMFMFAAIKFGAPQWFVLTSLLGTIIIVIGRYSGDSHYKLKEYTLDRKVNRFLGMKEIEQKFHFDKIISYKVTKSFDRDGKPVEKLAIKLKIAPQDIWITDQVNGEDFPKFRDAFIKTYENYKNPPKVNEDIQKINVKIGKVDWKTKDKGSNPINKD